MNPLGNILRLSLGDVVARALGFVSFVYLARVLGVESYGALEFALTIISYLHLVADGGLELWATREVARGHSVRRIAGIVFSLRLALTVLALSLLGVLLQFLPSYPRLRPLLLLFSLTLLAQVVDLKWALMGMEEMRSVATGLIISQILFASGIFLLVHDESTVLWVPILRLAGLLAMTVFLWRRIPDLHGKQVPDLQRNGWRQALFPALTLGTSRALALMSFNFDTLLLGLLVGNTTVGLYSAAYRPVTIVLAASATYFLGLFPVMTRSLEESSSLFKRFTTNSLTLTSLAAVPTAILGVFFAEEVIQLLYGDQFNRSAPVLQLLACSAALVLMRGTLRQALCAAGHQRTDMVCASIGAGTNVVLNMLLIPRYAMMGAAFATLISEIFWYLIAWYSFQIRVFRLPFLQPILKPSVAGLFMIAALVIARYQSPILKCLVSIGTYLTLLALMKVGDPREWFSEDQNP